MKINYQNLWLAGGLFNFIMSSYNGNIIQMLISIPLLIIGIFDFNSPNTKEGK